MTNKSNFLKAGLVALLIASGLPLAAHANSSLANDHSFISEVNAAYGTQFSSNASQGRASQPDGQNPGSAPAQYQN